MTDLQVAAPLLALEKLFDLIQAHSEFTKRFNDAYKHNLVFKDSFSIGKGMKHLHYFQ